jgi:signal transduction histidine kinase
MDAPRIARVISNLIQNGLQHTPPGGEVTIKAWREASEVILEVHDSGEGINAEDLPFIFETFYRGEKSRSRSTGGSGLGLAIARGLVEAHAGEIQASSNPNQGTTIHVRLPHESQT